MSIRKTLSTAARVMNELRHDPRTIALMLLVPCVLLIVLRYVFNDNQLIFDQIGPMTLGLFPLILMFIVTSIVTLRERKTGTLDRLMTMPLSKLDIVFGYALAFTAIATLQACLAALTILGLLGVTVLSGTMPVLLAAVAAAFLGTTLGLFVSAFANSEFQAVQFMPAIIFPQLLTCGLFAPREHMAKALQWFADVMPLTYSVDAMKQATTHATWTSTTTRDLLVVFGCGVVALVLGSVTIRRQEK